MNKRITGFYIHFFQENIPRAMTNSSFVHSFQYPDALPRNVKLTFLGVQRVKGYNISQQLLWKRTGVDLRTVVVTGNPPPSIAITNVTTFVYQIAVEITDSFPFSKIPHENGTHTTTIRPIQAGHEDTAMHSTLCITAFWRTWANARLFLTIGFGDFFPTTEAGKPIFIVYDGQPRSRSGPGPVQSVQDQHAWTDRTGPIVL